MSAEQARALDEMLRNVWVPETRRTLCDVLILVDQSTEPIAWADVVDRGWGGARQRRRGAAWPSPRYGR